MPATRAHAAHLTRHHTAQLMSFSTPMIKCSLQESETRPLALHVSLPARQRRNDLIVWVPPHTGLLDIEDEGAKLSTGSGSEERANRTRLATNGVNTGMAKLGDALKRLIIAVRHATSQSSVLSTDVSDLYRQSGHPDASARLATRPQAPRQAEW